MAKTKAQVIARSLRMLGKIGYAQTAESEINDDFEDAYDEVYEALSVEGLVSWASSSVPDEFVDHVASLVAFDRAEGIDQTRYERIALKAQIARLGISSKLTGKWTNPQEAHDF